MFNELNTFYIVASASHFREAAQRLKVSPSTVSQRVAALEKMVGGDLFERHTRNVKLTSLGEELLQLVEPLVVIADQTFQAVEKIADSEPKALQIGYIGSSGYGLVPRLIRYLSRNLPDVTLLPRSFQFSGQVETALLAPAGSEHYCDIGIVREPLRNTSLETIALFDDPLVLALPCSMKTQQSSLGDFVNAKTLLVYPSNSGSVITDQVLQLSRLGQIRPREIREVADTLTMLSLVASEQGVALLPRSSTVISVPFVNFVEIVKAPTTTVSIAWSRASSRRLPEDLRTVLRNFDGQFRAKR